MPLTVNSPADRYTQSAFSNLVLVTAVDVVTPITIAELQLAVRMTGASATQRYRAVIYTGPSNQAPTTRVANGSDVEVVGPYDIGTLALPVVATLAAGRYWVGIHIGELTGNEAPLAFGYGDNGAAILPAPTVGQYADYATGGGTLTGSYTPSSMRLTLTLSESASAPVAGPAAPTSTTLVWPASRAKRLDIVEQVQARLRDPLGVVMTKDEIKVALNDAVRAAPPSYVEVYRLQWELAEETQFPITVDLPVGYEYLDPIVIRYKWLGWIGQRQTQRITKYEVRDGQLQLTHLWHPVRPEGPLIVEADYILQPRQFATDGDVSGVSENWLVHATFMRVVRTFMRRSGEDFLDEMMESGQLIMGENLRSAGSPTITDDGRVY